MKNRFALLVAAPLLLSACAASSLRAQNQTASTRAAQTAPINLWVEAEDAARHNFLPGFSPMAGAAESGTSGGLYLSLRRDDAPDLKERLPFYAEYEITAPRAGNYVLWLAASPQDQSWASPLWLRVDGKPPVSLQGRKSSGAAWGDATTGRNYFSWIRAAQLNLKAGKHTLRLEVRAPRAGDKLWATFLDALLLTSDANYIPQGVHPSVSPRKTYEEEVAQSSPEAYRAALEEKLYQRGLAMTQENISSANTARVLAALRRRPLPTSKLRPPSPQIFGVHGMFTPFVLAGQNSEKIARAYELLARTGNDSFRTISSFWHHVGENADEFSQLDFQMDSGEKYGMTHAFGVGYPPEKFTRGNAVVSAAKPEYEGKYRDYLRALFAHVKQQNRRIDYLELGNEVDAPATWWRASSAQDYVNELRWVREERDRAGLKNPIVAFGATYARNDTLGGPDGGRRFMKEALKLGADKYADEYALHYTWPLAERDFPAFMRRAVKAAGGAQKPLMNTEEASYGAPSDVVKCFARDFFLYDMRRVDYYLARDWFENEVLISSGLFDRDWNPKLRLLPFALSVDAMKDRQLVGMAIPAPGVEAYVLKKIGVRGVKPKGAISADYRDSEYSLVMWKNASPPREQLSPEPQRGASLAPSRVGGVKAARAAFAWDLSALKVDAKTPVQVGGAPLVIFADAPPKWKMMTRAQFLSRVGATKSGQALLPQ